MNPKIVLAGCGNQVDLNCYANTIFDIYLLNHLITYLHNYLFTYIITYLITYLLTYLIICLLT